MFWLWNMLQIPAVSTSSSCCDDGYNTQWKTYQSNQQTTNNYVTVNGDNNYVNLNQNQRQISEQSSNQGPDFQQPEAQGCCGSNWNGPGVGVREGENPDP
jgi:hypothetical protein